MNGPKSVTRFCKLCGEIATGVVCHNAIVVRCSCSNCAGRNIEQVLDISKRRTQMFNVVQYKVISER